MIDVRSTDVVVVDVVYFDIVDDYTLRVGFSDGTERVIEFWPILIGPMFGPLTDLGLFNQVELNPEIGTLIWPTGADIDPSILHDWPAHVDAIIARRQRQFGSAAP